MNEISSSKLKEYLKELEVTCETQKEVFVYDNMKIILLHTTLNGSAPEFEVECCCANEENNQLATKIFHSIFKSELDSKKYYNDLKEILSYSTEETIRKLIREYVEKKIVPKMSNNVPKILENN